MAEVKNPFVLDLDTVHKWLDFIHDRIGDDRLYSSPNGKLPKHGPKKQEYDAYYSNFMLTGSGKFPKVSEKSPDAFRSTYDFHAEEGGKLTPLARIWIMQHQRKLLEELKVDKLAKVELVVDSTLCNLVKEKLDFDLKFRIISMIPSTSKIVRKHDNKIWRELFPEDFSVCCDVKDSAFVTFHKYRLISKEFNNRMQKKLMELDSLNLAKIFGLGETPKTIENFNKLAYLLSFINAKRKYVCETLTTDKSKDIDNFDIYQDFARIYACLQSCFTETSNLLMFSARGGTLYLNSSIAFSSNYKNNTDIDGMEEEKEIVPIYQNEDTEEFGGMFVEPEYVPKPPTLPVSESEEYHIQLIDSHSLDQLNVGKSGFESLVTKEEEEDIVEEYKTRAKKNKSLLFKELPTEDVALEFSNNSFEKRNISELLSLFPTGKLPEIIPHTQIPMPQRDNYFNVLLRRKLQREVPELFSTIYDDNITLFRHLTISSQTNTFNNLILNLILENGKEIPQELDEELLLSKKFRKNDLTEISLVEFELSSLLNILKNSALGGRRQFGAFFGPMSLFSKQKIEFRESVKNAVISSFETNVSKVNLLFYGKHCYSLTDDIETVLSHFPNVKEIRFALRLSSPNRQNISDVLHNTRLDFKNLCKLPSYDLDKIYVRVLDENIRLISREESTNTEEQELVTLNPLFENTKPKDNCLNISISSINQFQHQDIETLEKEIDIEFVRYPSLVLDFVKGATGIDKSKEIADYFLERGFLESYLIDNFDLYSEESRILKEYLIYRRKVSNSPIIRRENFYSTLAFENFIFDMYLGLDLISNPAEFEKSCLSPFAVKANKLYQQLLDPHHIIFTKLFFAKLFYENADTDMFIYFLEAYCNLLTDKVMIEEAEKQALSQNIELSEDRTKRSLQIFFTILSKPKDHPQHEEQKAIFNLEKIFSYLSLVATCFNYYDLFEALLTLGQHVFPNFNEIFTKSFLTGHFKYKANNRITASSINQESPGEMFEYDTKLERRKEFIKLLYNEGITDLDAKINPATLDERSVQDRAIPQNTCLLHLMARAGVPDIFMLYAIETITSSQLLVQDRFGNTCLHILSDQTCTNVEIYERIIQKQPKIINLVNNDLNSPLHVIAYLPFPNLFTIGKLLVEKYGANKDLVNAYGLTPYEIFMLTIAESRSLSDEKYYDVSWLLPTPGKTKKEIFMDMISNKY